MGKRPIPFSIIALFWEKLQYKFKRNPEIENEILFEFPLVKGSALWYNIG
jgi:hypothetical protein